MFCITVFFLHLAQYASISGVPAAVFVSPAPDCCACGGLLFSGAICSPVASVCFLLVVAVVAGTDRVFCVFCASLHSRIFSTTIAGYSSCTFAPASRMSAISACLGIECLLDRDHVSCNALVSQMMRVGCGNASNFWDASTDKSPASRASGACSAPNW